jgi:hypothetical protein
VKPWALPGENLAGRTSARVFFYEPQKSVCPAGSPWLDLAVTFLPISSAPDNLYIPGTHTDIDAIIQKKDAPNDGNKGKPCPTPPNVFVAETPSFSGNDGKNPPTNAIGMGYPCGVNPLLLKPSERPLPPIPSLSPFLPSLEELMQSPLPALPSNPPPGTQISQAVASSSSPLGPPATGAIAIEQVRTAPQPPPSRVEVFFSTGPNLRQPPSFVRRKPSPQKDVNPFSFATSRMDTNPLQTLTHLSKDRNGPLWKKTKEDHRNILDRPISDSKDVPAQLSRQAQANAMWNAMEYLEEKNSDYDSLPPEEMEVVQRMLDGANLPIEPKPMPVKRPTNIVVENKILGAGKHWAVDLVKCGGISNGRKSYARKVTFAEAPGIHERIRKGCLRSLRSIGADVGNAATLEELIRDIASRNRVSFEISQRIVQLSGAQNFQNPIVESWLAGDGTAAHPNGIYMEFAQGKSEDELLNRGKRAGRNAFFAELTPDMRASLFCQHATLSVMDYICGQTDRNPQNIILDVDKVNKTVPIRAIDNDLSLFAGSVGAFEKLNNALSLASIDYVSKDVYIGVLRLRPLDLARIFLANGRRVDTDEFLNACDRLEKCQAHLRKLMDEGGVLTNQSDWLT